MGSQRVRHNWATHTHILSSCKALSLNLYFINKFDETIEHKCEQRNIKGKEKVSQLSTFQWFILSWVGQWLYLQNSSFRTRCKTTRLTCRYCFLISCWPWFLRPWFCLQTLPLDPWCKKLPLFVTQTAPSLDHKAILHFQKYIRVVTYIQRRQWHSTPVLLAWKIPWTEEPGRLQSMGSLRVGHDWVTSLSLFTFMHWRRKCQPTPVFLPGESQGWGSLVGCRLWGRTE